MMRYERHDFTQVGLAEFGHHPADFGKLHETFGAGDQFKTEPGGGGGIMLGNVAHSVRQIGAGRRSDDYLPAHEAFCALTCSMGTHSPRSNSAKLIRRPSKQIGYERSV